jgi:hypothetical protein
MNIIIEIVWFVMLLYVVLKLVFYYIDIQHELNDARMLINTNTKDIETLVKHLQNKK